jgi:hypothetical protein
MRSNIRFAAFIALVFLAACGGRGSPTQTTPLPPGTPPTWSNFVLPLTANPNPATTRNAITFTTTIQVNQDGAVITGTDTYYLEYPDGHRVFCMSSPTPLEFVKKYDLRGGCDVMKTSDPEGDYKGILIHEESGNGFTKTFDPVAVTVHVTKG